MAVYNDVFQQLLDEGHFNVDGPYKGVVGDSVIRLVEVLFEQTHTEESMKETVRVFARMVAGDDAGDQELEGAGVGAADEQRADPGSGPGEGGTVPPGEVHLPT